MWLSCSATPGATPGWWRWPSCCAPAIAITCSRQCPLADAASEALVAVTLRDQINEFWVQSFASSAKHLLASMVFSQDYAHNMEHNARYEAFGRDNLWPLMEEKPYKK